MFIEMIGTFRRCDIQFAGEALGVWEGAVGEKEGRSSR